MRFASDSVTIEDGAYLEFGVCSGSSINFIAALNPQKKIYGFDSFEGLPKKWEYGDHVFPAGAFSFRDEHKDKSYVPIYTLRNVDIFKGWFN